VETSSPFKVMPGSMSRRERRLSWDRAMARSGQPRDLEGEFERAGPRMEATARWMSASPLELKSIVRN
jgi:hypothetical protein